MRMMSSPEALRPSNTESNNEINAQKNRPYCEKLRTQNKQALARDDDRVCLFIREKTCHLKDNSS
jgi:hypothetical protein